MNNPSKYAADTLIQPQLRINQDGFIAIFNYAICIFKSVQLRTLIQIVCKTPALRFYIFWHMIFVNVKSKCRCLPIGLRSSLLRTNIPVAVLCGSRSIGFTDRNPGATAMKILNHSDVK